MNIDYVSFAYLQEYEQKFKDIINERPAVAQAYEKAKTAIEQSIFKGKLELVMLVKNNQVWFAPSITYSHSALNRINAYTGVYGKLVKQVESNKVTIA